MDNIKVYVGIDFGTAGTTFSYWFTDANELDIQPKRWSGTGANSKTTTEIILGGENLEEIYAFGVNCMDYINSTNYEQKPYHHYTNIKMKLYENTDIIYSENSKKPASLIHIIKKILEYIKKESIEEINKIRTNILESEIKWVVTVPAVWKDSSKEKMMIASIQAGLIKKKDDKSNFFALEPEAAAYYYARSSSSDKNVLKEPYIICDLGGGTADISTHKREENNGIITIHELFPPTGGKHGSTYINQNFIDKILKLLFTENSFDVIQSKIDKGKNGEDDSDLLYEMDTFLKNVEMFKKSFDLDKLGQYYNINCQIFKEGFEEEKSIEELVENYNNKCRLQWKVQIKNQKKWIIQFPYEIIRDLTKEIIVDEVSKYIKEIISTLGSDTIKSIIYVGGLSSSNAIFKMFQNELPEIKTHVIAPETEIIVSKGAILFAKNPYVISSRKAQYTIGIRSEGKWKEKYEKGGELFIDPLTQEKFCENLFVKFLTKGQDIKFDTVKTKKFFMNSEVSNIKFFKSNLPNPHFIDQRNENGEKVTQQFGELTFYVDENFDINEPLVEIKVQLGGTYINAEVIYLKTGKKGIAEFSYLD